MRRNKRISTWSIALVGLLSAVSLVFLFLASVIPSGWTGVTAVAGLGVAVAVAACGYLSGILGYVLSGLLALLLLPAKHVAVLYLCLFGLYPVLKSLFEKCRLRIAEYLFKLAFFNLVLFGLYWFAFGLFFASGAADWNRPIPFVLALFLGGNIVFLLYDYAFSKVMVLLQKRVIQPIQQRRAGR